LHSLVDRLAVLFRQIGTTDAHVDYLDAEALGLAVQLLARAGHKLRTLLADDVRQRRFAEHTAQRGV
jgi:hypothetical protein